MYIQVIKFLDNSFHEPIIGLGHFTSGIHQVSTTRYKPIKPSLNCF